MWRPVYVALASIWVLVVFTASAHAQALAPTTLGLASHDQKAADDMVQVITEKSAQKTADKPPKPITKKTRAGNREKACTIWKGIPGPAGCQRGEGSSCQ